MNAPQQVDISQFAPCGMNCLLCYKHLGKHPCPGCLSQDPAKPKHCGSCAIKACVAEKGISYCFLCAGYPCKRMKALDKSYRTRYGVSLMESGRSAKALGVAQHLKQQLEQYTCTACGGIICLHDGTCSSCGKESPLGRRSQVK